MSEELRRSCGIAWLLAAWLALPIQARVADGDRMAALKFQNPGDVGMALLIEYYSQLPDRKDGENREAWTARLNRSLEKFKKKTGERYKEGTLQRLLNSSDFRARRASVLALGLLGTMASNKPMAAMLRDEDGVVRQLAADSLWALWFRADSEANNRELQRLMHLEDPAQAVTGLDALVKKAPKFAEAYNQRAILHFRLQEFQKSIADCEKVIQLNPCHFGAQAGMAQCYMKLKKPKAALRAFRGALKINPNMEGVQETIRALEDVLGEEGKK